MKNKNDHHLLLLLIALFILLIILLFMIVKNRSFYFAVNSQKRNKSIEKNNQTARFMQKFTAGYLDFMIEVPEYFTMTDDFTFVDLESKKGSISIGRVGTNFDSLDGYILDLAEKNHLNILQKTELRLYKYPTIKVTIENTSNRNDTEELIYFIYVDGWVYSFETNASSLSHDLEKIVNSFQYHPV